MNKKEIAKISVSVILLSILFVLVDWKKVVSAVKNVSMYYYIIAYSFATAGTFISIYRWEKIVEFQNESVKFRRLATLYYIGKFYNILIPGSIGGDIVRGYKTSKEDGDGITLFSSVAVERVVGVISILMVMLVSPIYLDDILPPEVKLQFIIFALFISIGLFILFNKKLQLAVISLLPDHPLCNKVGRVSMKMGNSIRLVSNPRFISKMLILSLLFIFISKLTLFFIAKSLGTSLPYLYIVATTTIITIVTMVPVSFGGLGVREALFIYFFSFLGVTPEDAIAIGIIGYSMRIVDATIGGLLNLIEK